MVDFLLLSFLNFGGLLIFMFSLSVSMVLYLLLSFLNLGVKKGLLLLMFLLSVSMVNCLLLSYLNFGVKLSFNKYVSYVLIVIKTFLLSKFFLWFYSSFTDNYIYEPFGMDLDRKS
jgi:hypothetical protein